MDFISDRMFQADRAYILKAASKAKFNSEWGGMFQTHALFDVVNPLVLLAWQESMRAVSFCN